MRNGKHLLLLLACLTAATMGKTQTLFQTAKDDALINFADSTMSQLKINLASSTFGYRWDYTETSTPLKRKYLLASLFTNFKPNKQGYAKLIQDGTLQPGVQVGGSIGMRIKSNIGFYILTDIVLKPSLQADWFTVYDPALEGTGTDPLYKKSKVSKGVDLNTNLALFPNKWNIYLGLQAGYHWTNNGDDLDDAIVTKEIPYAGSSSQTIQFEDEAVKYGQLTNVQKAPFKIDALFDPGIPLGNDELKNHLGFFTYFRTDFKQSKQRLGFGLSLLDAQNPATVFTSIGYELPAMGNDITPAVKQKDKGVFFVTIGYTIK